MKLSLFSITAILASFVAKNPILAPRASSSPFRLYGDFGSDTSFPLLAILPVAEPNHRGYYQFDWYGKGSQKIELYFTQDETHPGPVFDFRKNGYEMVMQAVKDKDTGTSYYRPLLIDRANTALSGLQSPGRSYDHGRFCFSPDGSENSDDPNGKQWITCIRSTTRVETDPEYVEELYFGNFLPRGCAIGRKPVYLTGIICLLPGFNCLPMSLPRIFGFVGVFASIGFVYQREALRYMAWCFFM